MNGTKGKMAEAFKELVCKKSFQKITISDIAKESAMTRENFYYHFRDKYDIMHWIFEQQVADSFQRMRSHLKCGLMPCFVIPVKITNITGS